MNGCYVWLVNRFPCALWYCALVMWVFILKIIGENIPLILIVKVIVIIIPITILIQQWQD